MNSKIYTTEFIPYAYNTKFSLHGKVYDLDCKDIVVLDDYLDKLETAINNQLEFIKTLKNEVVQIKNLTIVKIHNFNLTVSDVLAPTKSTIDMMTCHLAALYFCKNKQLVKDLLTNYKDVVEIVAEIDEMTKLTVLSHFYYTLDLDTDPGHFQNAIEKIKSGMLNIYAGDYNYEDLRSL